MPQRLSVDLFSPIETQNTSSRAITYGADLGAICFFTPSNRPGYIRLPVVGRMQARLLIRHTKFLLSLKYSLNTPFAALPTGYFVLLSHKQFSLLSNNVSDEAILGRKDFFVFVFLLLLFLEWLDHDGGQKCI